MQRRSWPGHSTLEDPGADTWHTVGDGATAEGSIMRMRFQRSPQAVLSRRVSKQNKKIKITRKMKIQYWRRTTLREWEEEENLMKVTTGLK